MKHFLNEIEVSPDNRLDVNIVSDFTGNPNILSLGVNTLRFSREAKEMILQHIQDNGVFVGIPYRIELANGINLNCYIDLCDNMVIRDHHIEVNVKRRDSKDNFDERAKGASYEYLSSVGVEFETIEIPYYIVPDNQLEQGLILVVSTYIMTEATVKAGMELADAIGDLTEATTPAVGGAGPSVVIGAIISASIRAIARAIYFALLLVALIEMATQLLTLLFPPQRKLKGIKYDKLLKDSCAYLGYDFQSSIFQQESGWTILPVPLIHNRQGIFETLPDAFVGAFNKGYPSSSDTIFTIAQAFDAAEIMFNARTFIHNGVVRLERRDWLQNNAPANIIPALSNQNERSDEYTYNTEDIWKRYYIHYQLDSTDLNTMDKIYDIHDAEYSTEVSSVAPNDLKMVKGLNDVSIPFSLGARKGQLNWLELMGKKYLELVDAVAGIFGQETNFASQIGDRTNSLVVSSQFFSVTKILYTTNGRQSENFGDFVSAKHLWDKYHSINAIQNNAWEIHKTTRIRLTQEEFLTLNNQNWIDIDGIRCEILRIEWIDEKSFASITYRKPSTYPSNRVTTLTIN